MSRSRAWIARLTPAVLTVFLAGGVVPRAVVLVHRHAGAEQPHSHASDADFSPRSLVPIHPFSERPPSRRGPGLWASGEDGWHAHTQDPFQHGAVPGVARVLRTEAGLSVGPTAAVTASAPVLLFAAARGPPVRA